VEINLFLREFRRRRPFSRLMLSGAGFGPKFIANSLLGRQGAVYCPLPGLGFAPLASPGHLCGWHGSRTLALMVGAAARLMWLGVQPKLLVKGRRDCANGVGGKGRPAWGPRPPPCGGGSRSGCCCFALRKICYGVGLPGMEPRHLLGGVRRGGSWSSSLRARSSRPGCPSGSAASGRHRRHTVAVFIGLARHLGPGYGDSSSTHLRRPNGDSPRCTAVVAMGAVVQLGGRAPLTLAGPAWVGG